MPEFYLSNNLIFAPDKIAAVYALEPVDLIIMPEQDQLAFEIDLRRTLHALQEGGIEIIMRTRKALPGDFDRHFASFHDTAGSGATGSQNLYAELLKGYTAQMAELLEKNIIPVKEYYLVFAHQAQTKNPQSVMHSLDMLERQIDRTAGTLKRTGIELKQVEGPDLTKLMATFTRL